MKYTALLFMLVLSVSCATSEPNCQAIRADKYTLTMKCDDGSIQMFDCRYEKFDDNFQTCKRRGGWYTEKQF